MRYQIVVTCNKEEVASAIRALIQDSKIYKSEEVVFD